MQNRTYPLPDNAADGTIKVITDFLIARRKELGLSQEQLAERMASSKFTISKIEACKWNLGMRIFIQWCYALDCNPYLVPLEASPEWMEKAMGDLGRRPDRLPKN